MTMFLNNLTLEGAFSNNGSAALDLTLQSDGTIWQPVYPEQLVNPSRAFVLKDEFIAQAAPTIAGDLGWTITTTGGASVVAANSTNVDVNKPGILRITAGTANGNSAGIVFNSSTGFFKIGGGAIYNEWLVNIPSLATVTNDYTARIGIGDSASLDFTNGIYFQYNRGTSTDWLLKAASASTRTTTTSTTAVAAGWHKLGILINAAGTSVDFYVNGVVIGTIATNIPTAALNFAAHQVRVAGTPVGFEMDYFWFYQRFTTAR